MEKATSVVAAGVAINFAVVNPRSADSIDALLLLARAAVSSSGDGATGKPTAVVELMEAYAQAATHAGQQGLKRPTRPVASSRDSQPAADNPADVAMVPLCDGAHAGKDADSTKDGEDEHVVAKNTEQNGSDHTPRDTKEDEEEDEDDGAHTPPKKPRVTEE